MENIGIVCGIVLGLFGSIFSVVQFFYQKNLNERLAREQKIKEKEQEAKALEKEKAQEAKALEQAKKQEVRDRMSLLMQIIIDKDIPRESRQPFYDEYVSLGGNGSVIKLWATGN